MSLEKVQEFLTKIGEDESLQTELAEALQSENDRQAVTELAQSKGYEFTSDELWAEIQKRQAELEQKAGSRELSDEELEAVAGGFTPTVLAIVTVGVSAAFTVAISIDFGKPKW